MKFWKCAVCAEKDSRIADLKEQLAHQNAMLKAQVSPQYASAVTIEANRALEGGGTEQIDVSEDQKKHFSAVERQAIEILTGNYN